MLKRATLSLTVGAALGIVAITPVAFAQEILVESAFTSPPDVATERDHPFRTDTVEVTVPPFTQNFGQLEYKITMDEGDVIVFSWTSDRPVVFDFHGHNEESDSGDPLYVMEYFSGESQESSGTLIAALSGVHGWYFANSEFDAPAIVTLHLSGYYDLEPGVEMME